MNKIDGCLSPEKIKVSVPLRVPVVFVRLNIPNSGWYPFPHESKTLRRAAALKKPPYKLKTLGIGRSSKAARPKPLPASWSGKLTQLFCADWARARQYLKQGCAVYLSVILCGSCRADWWINTARWVSKAAGVLSSPNADGRMGTWLCYKRDLASITSSEN